MNKDEYDEWKGITGAGQRLREMIAQENKKYQVIRFFKDSDEIRIINTGLSLEEAKEHCSDPSTRSQEWFDGYERSSDV